MCLAHRLSRPRTPACLYRPHHLPALSYARAHSHKPAQTRASPHTLAQACPHSRKPAHTHASPAHTRASLSTLAQARVHSHKPAHTRASPHTLAQACPHCLRAHFFFLCQNRPLARAQLSLTPASSPPAPSAPLRTLFFSLPKSVTRSHTTTHAVRAHHTHMIFFFAQIAPATCAYPFPAKRTSLEPSKPSARKLFFWVQIGHSLTYTRPHHPRPPHTHMNFFLLRSPPPLVHTLFQPREPVWNHPNRSRANFFFWVQIDHSLACNELPTPSAPSALAVFT